MSFEEDRIRIQAFDKQIALLNEKYTIDEQIDRYFNFEYLPQRKQGRFKFYFKDDIQLPLEVREDCIEIFSRYFPTPEGVHGLIGLR